MSHPGFTRPDLCSIRAVAEQAEFADVGRRLSADGYPVADDDPLAPLARDVARVIVEASFTFHYRDRYDPLYRLGEECLKPVQAITDTRPSKIEISWTIHDLLPEWYRRAAYHRTRNLMNAVLAGILHVFPYPIRQPGSGGAWLVTGRRGQRTGAGR